MMISSRSDFNPEEILIKDAKDKILKKKFGNKTSRKKCTEVATMI